MIGPTTVVSIVLGAGWHCGRLGFVGARALYGENHATFLELRIRLRDGHEQRVVIDGTWQSGPIEIVGDDLYDGQIIDARPGGRAHLRPGPAPRGASSATRQPPTPW